MKSLLNYIGFRHNGGQELKIAAMDRERHSVSVALPEDQMEADSQDELGKKPTVTSPVAETKLVDGS
jgi:hypothetical protein